MKCLSYISSFLLFSHVVSLSADTIKIHNETDDKLYAAVYYYPSSYNLTRRFAQRVGDIIELPAGQSKDLNRPERKIGYDRDVLFYNPKTAEHMQKQLEPVLKREITRDAYKTLPKFNIGTLEGSEFYVTLEETGAYKIFTSTQWKLRPIKKKITDVTDSMTEAFKNRLKKQFERPELAVAQVATGSSLSDGEQRYLQARLPKVKRALEDLTGLKLNDHDILRIGLVGSGGGYRAMIASLGSVIGAHETGLLDAISYFSALSGSTWMLAPWTTMGLSPREYLGQLIPRIREKYPQLTDIQFADAINQLYKKLLFDEPLTTIDLFGALLATKLLAGPGLDPYKLTLDGQIPRVEQGNWVYPVYTSVVTKADPYGWVEYTPHTVGSDYLGGYVPSYAFGRSFAKGTSTNFAPPQLLGFLMGIWGSAFSANFKEIYQSMVNKLPNIIKDTIKNATEELKFGTIRLLPAKVFNYTLGMPGLPRNQEKILTLLDAGVSCNLPGVPLLRKQRKLDVLIFLDASETVDGAPQLRCVEEYARKNSIKFPKINYENIGNKIVSIFKDESDPSVPIVIYLPRIKNSNYSKKFDPTENLKSGGYLSMDNFAYTADQVRELAGLTEFNIKESKEAIVKAIKELILARRESEQKLVKK